MLGIQLDFAGDSSEVDKYCGVWESRIHMCEEAAAKHKAASKEPEVAAADGGVKAGTSEWSVAVPPNPKKRKLDTKVCTCFTPFLLTLTDLLQEDDGPVYTTHHPGCERCERLSVRDPEPCMLYPGKKCTRCQRARQACSLLTGKCAPVFLACLAESFYLARREVIELDNSSDEEEAPVRLRRARRNKGKAKKASTSREDVNMKLRSFETRLKEAAQTF